MAIKNVRLSDLASRTRQHSVKLLSVRLPVRLIDRIDQVVTRLGSGKAEVVVALLNEGLDRFDSERRAKRSRRSGA